MFLVANTSNRLTSAAEKKATLSPLLTRKSSAFWNVLDACMKTSWHSSLNSSKKRDNIKKFAERCKNSCLPKLQSRWCSKALLTWLNLQDHQKLAMATATTAIDADRDLNLNLLALRKVSTNEQPNTQKFSCRRAKTISASNRYSWCISSASLKSSWLLPACKR